MFQQTVSPSRVFQCFRRALNECIFTLMYHVAGDCHQPEVLFQLPLMGLFTKIIESSTSVSLRLEDTRICLSSSFICKHEAISPFASTSLPLAQVSQDAMNMIEYVMDRFLDLAHLSPELCANFLYTANMAAAECSLQKQRPPDPVNEAARSSAPPQQKPLPALKSEPVLLPKLEPEEEKDATEWSLDDINCLLTVYLNRCTAKGALSSRKDDQWVTDILLDLNDSGVHKTRLEVVQQLHRLNLIQDATLEEQAVLSEDKPPAFISEFCSVS